MRSEAGSEVVHYRGGGGGLASQQRYGEAEEEWVTKKKVEITTTKNVERKIQRQLVLEDGRVVEEEVPTVTVDTSEDKQTFETDHDEDRRVMAGNGMDIIHSKFNNSGGLLVGDKFTSVKKVQDVKENLVKTEAVQDLGDIATRDLDRVMKEKENIRKYLRKRNEDPNSNRAVAVPRTVYTKRNHRVVTDKEDIQERNWLNDGKMQNERIKTEEHIEYDSDDTPESGSESSESADSRHVLEPEVYKTRKDENFTEYFKYGKGRGKENRVKVGEGPHYVSESKEVQREEDNRLVDLSTRSPRIIHLDTGPSRSKKPITHTDSWLERHFGSSSSSLSNSSVDLSRGGQAGSGLRRSASICDIRPVTESSNNTYYATVRKTAKVPAVVRREKKDDYYIQNRQSANFSSSGHPVRPPRRKKNTDSESSNNIYGSRQETIYGTSRKPEYIYGTLKRTGDKYSFQRENGSLHSNTDSSRNDLRDHSYNHQRRSEYSENIKNSSSLRREERGGGSDRYFFGSPSTGRSQTKPSNRSFSPAPQKISRHTNSKSHHQSTGNIYGHLQKEKTDSLRERYSSSTDLYYSTDKYNRSGDAYSASRSRDPYARPSSAAARGGGGYSTHRETRSTAGGVYSTTSRQAKDTYTPPDRDPRQSKDIYSSPQIMRAEPTQSKVRDIYIAKTNDIYATPVSKRDTVGGRSSPATPLHRFTDSTGSLARTIPIQTAEDSRDDPIIPNLSRQSRKDLYTSSKDSYSNSREIYASPRHKQNSAHHRIVYSAESPMGSPSTKYRTKIVLNGGLA